MAHRTGRIDARTLRNAVQAIDDLCAEIRVIGIDYTLAHLAGELAERHGLRGYDAVHLASVISIDDPGLLTATWDGELAAATFACGYAVAPA